MNIENTRIFTGTPSQVEPQVNEFLTSHPRAVILSSAIAPLATPAAAEAPEKPKATKAKEKATPPTEGEETETPAEETPPPAPAADCIIAVICGLQF